MCLEDAVGKQVDNNSSTHLLTYSPINPPTNHPPTVQSSPIHLTHRTPSSSRTDSVQLSTTSLLKSLFPHLYLVRKRRGLQPSSISHQSIYQEEREICLDAMIQFFASHQDEGFRRVFVEVAKRNVEGYVNFVRRRRIDE